MKKLILFLAIAGIFTQAQAQKISEKDVPVAVTDAFMKAHPSVLNAEWSKEGNKYEAKYDRDKTDMTDSYEASGRLSNCKMDIPVTTLPMRALEYVKKNNKEPEELKKAYKNTDGYGVVTYETHLKGKHMIFDADGNFITAVEH